MGTYNDKGEKKSVGQAIITGVADFGESLLKASEIEFIDLKKMRDETNFPITFFIVNVSIDRVLLEMKEKRPDLVPPLKEYKTKRENKKEKKD